MSLKTNFLTPSFGREIWQSLTFKQHRREGFALDPDQPRPKDVEKLKDQKPYCDQVSKHKDKAAALSKNPVNDNRIRLDLLSFVQIFPYNSYLHGIDIFNELNKQWVTDKT